MSSSEQTHDIPDSEASDPGYRSRSQSRRSRRRKQQQKQKQPQQETIPEDPQQPPLPSANNSQMKTGSAQSASNYGTMQPFERIGPPETSMDGPVTYARAQRGEIPMRNPDGSQGQMMTAPQGGGKGQSDIMDKDGLKLRIELNLDVEIELKASIRGDVTLALL